MPRKTAYTSITPIPSHIPRQLGIDLLHSHGELIELNPLVTEHHQIKPPRDAPADEYFSTWYEITEKIQYIPGTGKMGSGKISFRGVYHDMPWGLQTHTYLPAGIDLRVKYSIRGNQPGEPPEVKELGSAAPAEGLYMREDIEIKCNFTMVSYVKSGMKKASKVMIDRLVKKAELIDAEVLKQMMDAHGSDGGQSAVVPGHSPGMPPPSPGMGQFSPNPAANTDPSTLKRNSTLAGSEVLRRREENLRQQLYNSGSLQPQQQQQQQPNQGYHRPNNNAMEMMGDFPSQNSQMLKPQQFHNSNPGLAIEMPGDTHFHRSPQPSPNLPPPRHSTYSELSGDGGQNANNFSRPSSVTHEGMSSGWGGSQTSSNSPAKMDLQQQQQHQGQGGYRYNPRDFAQELPTGR